MRNRVHPAQLRTPGRLFRAGRRKAAQTGIAVPSIFTLESCRETLRIIRAWYVEKNYGHDPRLRGNVRV
jgi:hypothetical protein